MKAFTFAQSSYLLRLGSIAAITLLWQVVPVVPSDTFYCGTDWSDATTYCHQHCPGGTDMASVRPVKVALPTQAALAPRRPLLPNLRLFL
jgi:hypothetical protein